jgi:hypothetical protein
LAKELKLFYLRSLRATFFSRVDAVSDNGYFVFS